MNTYNTNYTSIMVYNVTMASKAYNYTKKLARQQNNCCYYCNIRFTGIHVVPSDTTETLATFDHILPKSQGGIRSLENGVAACYKCNRDRGDVDFVEFTWSIILNQAC